MHFIQMWQKFKTCVPGHETDQNMTPAVLLNPICAVKLNPWWHGFE